MPQLTLAQITRAMTCLVHGRIGHSIDFGGYASHPGSLPLFQYNVEMVIDGPELFQTLDDFAERYLLPMATMLADRLKQSSMCYSYQLSLPARKDLSAVRCLYEGMSLRGILDETQPVIDGVTYPRTLRFDVCGSKEKAEKLAA